MSSLIIIPARLGSTRLPNKILADINGKTMINRVFDQAKQVLNSKVFVACGDIEIANEVESFSGNFVMTDSDLPSGTDRIHAAFSQLDLEKNYEYIVNLQGDVPNIDPSVIEQTVNVLDQESECDIATAVIKLQDVEKASDPNIVKAIADFSNNQTISECSDFTREKPQNANDIYYEHIGIYVYRIEALLKFVKLSQSKREIDNKLEQLRGLDNGMRIFACLINNDQKPINVDTQDSLEQARRLIAV
ncbi:3-deoxy-manno-octulosonate cytidylyltransferase [Rickettsiales bacterium]|nr:3-deoxy-manno-octulosonate cytidylyltransferase [Rickettsiales bacterium]